MTHAFDPEDLVVERLQDNLELKRSLLADATFRQLVARIGSALAEVLGDGKKVFFFGNGGSAADAQHLAAELTGRFVMERASLPGIALTVNTSSLTAIANDYSFEQVFSRQVESLGSPGDAAIGITTSGRSPNVLLALQAARNRRLLTVALTGSNTSDLAPLVDYCLSIPSENTARIQEAHILTGHILCEIIERKLFGEHSSPAPSEQLGQKPRIEREGVAEKHGAPA